MFVVGTPFAVLSIKIIYKCNMLVKFEIILTKKTKVMSNALFNIKSDVPYRSSEKSEKKNVLWKALVKVSSD